MDVSEDADGNKTYTASDTARTETPDTAAAQAFISSAATLYFSSSADFKPTDEALAAYGLAEPSATLTVEWTRTDDASGAQESVTSVLYLGAVDPNGDYYARLADSNAVSTLNATALSGVLGMTLDGMRPQRRRALRKVRLPQRAALFPRQAQRIEGVAKRVVPLGLFENGGNTAFLIFKQPLDGLECRR